MQIVSKPLNGNKQQDDNQCWELLILQIQL